MKVFIFILMFFITGCSTPLGKEIVGDKPFYDDDSCSIPGMIVEPGDDDNCISPGVKYCVTEGLVYMISGDRDNCQSPRSYCQGNPGEC